MSESLHSAEGKLIRPPSGVPPFPIEELPRDAASPAWAEIRNTYSLTLREFTALQNLVNQPHGMFKNVLDL